MCSGPGNSPEQRIEPKRKKRCEVRHLSWGKEVGDVPEEEIVEDSRQQSHSAFLQI
jgi:hypothetical protein